MTSATDAVARVLARCRRSLDGMQVAEDAQLAEVMEALAALTALCDVFDASTQRIAEVVRGLRDLDPALRRANGLDDSAEGSDARSSLRTWMYRIATNVCLDAPAKEDRRARPVEDAPRRAAVQRSQGTDLACGWGAVGADLSRRQV